MPHRMIVTSLGAVFCLLSLAGCTAPSQGQPQATGTQDTGTTQPPPTASPPSAPPDNGDLPTNGAPKVRNPLDTSRFQQDPCQILRPTQLQALNMGAQGEQEQGPLGLTCAWRNSETGGNVQLQWTGENPRGLSAVYRADKAGKYKYFIELPEIDGYPAVAADVIDGRDVGRCVVQVGTSDKVNFLASLQLSRANVGKKDPCEVTAQVAGMMVKTMKAGG